ncbi:hypothetical protein BU24DRAFT_7114 [Aaosphaeria arxii CBS 175.79]|uniref:Uncharacterized protein n=1 Tax=Aaosphaeria arxii CBS 175.79 TaxID=1450172 RepID=A0A6A5Y5Y7_9PLEO|nr:uncharacterized protein BU24DRAFT_7114 [Aaosphaeria arxii CBS 175.79]KAF2020709.1 hypothetical protein BU24DRAFT_7114 [Aaosphaeria arxii CBS 175.79]
MYHNSRENPVSKQPSPLSKPTYYQPPAKQPSTPHHGHTLHIHPLPHHRDNSDELLGRASAARGSGDINGVRSISFGVILSGLPRKYCRGGDDGDVECESWVVRLELRIGRGTLGESVGDRARGIVCMLVWLFGWLLAWFLRVKLYRKCGYKNRCNGWFSLVNVLMD